MARTDSSIYPQPFLPNHLPLYSTTPILSLPYLNLTSTVVLNRCETPILHLSNLIPSSRIIYPYTTLILSLSNINLTTSPVPLSNPKPTPIQPQSYPYPTSTLPLVLYPYPTPNLPLSNPNPIPIQPQPYLYSPVPLSPLS